MLLVCFLVSSTIVGSFLMGFAAAFVAALLLSFLGDMAATIHKQPFQKSWDEYAAAHSEGVAALQAICKCREV